MAWTVKVGQASDPIGIRTQDRITNIRVTESFGHVDFSVTVKNPTPDERIQPKGRMDSAIIQIKRKTDIIAEGFIEDTEDGADYVTYSGRSFIVLTGYSTASTTAKSGATEAEFSNKSGQHIINNLISNYCTTKDTEVASSAIFTEIYEGDVKLHGKKVYQIVREMCQSYGYDFWSSATWVGDNVTVKTINVGEKVRGTTVSPYKTLQGGVHLKNIPIIKYRASQAINCLRVIGGGTGKDKVSEFVEDTTSIVAIGYVEGEPYHNNMIRSVATAQSIGQAIIDAKKDPIEELHVDLAMYISDLEYGDWVNIIDTHSNLDTTKRIKKITRTYSVSTADTMSIELGEKFDDYQNIIRDLTKGDVDAEPNMTMGGGSLRITANDPPSEWVRIDEGTWYGTDGILHEIEGGRTAAWLGGGGTFPSGSGGYRKAVVQIHDTTWSITSALGTIVGDATTAQNEVVSADADNTPIGEIILRQSGSADAISDIYDKSTTGKSYIYRDARPIVGSSAAGYGGEGRWKLSIDDTWTASTAYIVGDFIGPTTVNGWSYECTTSGTSSTGEPSWPIVLGTIVVDGGIIWTCRYVHLIPDDINNVTDLNIYVKSQGSGIVYLG